MTQCGDSCTSSIFPLYTDKDLVVDDSIAGVWKEWHSALASRKALEAVLAKAVQSIGLLLHTATQ